MCNMISKVTNPANKYNTELTKHNLSKYIFEYIVSQLRELTNTSSERNSVFFFLSAFYHGGTDKTL
uniref:Uncharacterized protein n=1 Tax=Octopus bimaculoides TaxID=37653 RepID=A0A0L8HZT0_OCTBM